MDEKPVASRLRRSASHRDFEQISHWRRLPRPWRIFLVDGVQSVGIIETNIEALQIDASQSRPKGLLGLYGMGLLYVDANGQTDHCVLARFGVDLGSGSEAALGSDNYRLMPGARRFDLGNHNYVGAYAVAESIDLLNDISTKTRGPCWRTHPAIGDGRSRSITCGLAPCGRSFYKFIMCRAPWRWRS